MSSLVFLLCIVVASLLLSSRAYSLVPPPRDSEEKEMLHRILRVDHAGEYGANRIYAGQMAVLGRSSTGPLIQVRTEGGIGVKVGQQPVEVSALL